MRGRGRGRGVARGGHYHQKEQFLKLYISQLRLNKFM